MAGNHILEIKDLRVSFRTNNGTVKAVRGISVDLDKGETLAIVGESGSGKSVTAKAIMGILAGNSIIDNGEIIFDGKDLLKISEKEFHNYRGNRIAMIFQDPLSSLNPIMKIGRQMTEAIVINGKAKQRDARRDFAQRLKILSSYMDKDAASKELIKTFKKNAAAGARLFREYSVCRDLAGETVSDIKDVLAEIINGYPKKVAREISAIISEAAASYHDFVSDKNSELPRLLSDMKAELKNYKNGRGKEPMIQLLEKTLSVIEAACNRPAPDFFALAYYKMTKPGAALPSGAKAVDGLTLPYFKENLYKPLAALIEKAITKSYSESGTAKAKAVKILSDNRSVFEGSLDKAACLRAADIMIKAVESSIDRCAVKKDSWAYIFGSSLKNSIESYFKGIEQNERESRRFKRDTIKYDKLKARGKADSTVVPAVIVDLEMHKRNMLSNIQRMIDNYTADLNTDISTEAASNSAALIEQLFESAKNRINKITKRIATNRAIRVMKDVGIPEPRKRFKQYPFEFSGGMRQRIVIAIALSSNPDILICDEPTTALDVTIQSQILELINGMKAKYKLSVIFITHDLGVVANMADKIAVMYAGKIVEYGLTEEIFYKPAHPYTWALLASTPDLDTQEKLDAIPGTPPNMIFPPAGDAFAERNKFAMKIDFQQQPPEFYISDTHWAASWLLHPKAPKVEPPKIVTERIARMQALRQQNGGQA
jgi:oligopeptide/dipeptide ABC transporter ATP-binding protein